MRLEIDVSDPGFGLILGDYYPRTGGITDLRSQEQRELGYRILDMMCQSFPSSINN